MTVNLYLQAVQDSHQHSVTYTLSRNQAVIVEYKHDGDTDMFQVSYMFVHDVNQYIIIFKILSVSLIQSNKQKIFSNIAEKHNLLFQKCVHAYVKKQ